MIENRAADRERTLAFLNEEITRENEQLLRSAEGIDTKATFVAGVAVAVVTFLLGNRREWLLVVALILYGVGFGLAVASFWPRRWAGLIPASLRQLIGADPVPSLTPDDPTGGKAPVTRPPLLSCGASMANSDD